jgi:hypothetical protein
MMVAASHCGIDPMPWGVFSFLGANEDCGFKEEHPHANMR